MDYVEKKTQLSNIIKMFIRGIITVQALQNYSWEVIDEYLEKNQNRKTDLDTSVFWFAIWQIQHLASEEHEKDGTLNRELKLILEYLQGQRPMPPGAYGLPPSKKTKH